MEKTFRILLRRNLEGIIWLTALIFLAFQDPGSHHYTLCPLKNLGFDFCPGCGLGRSVTYFFHGDLSGSFHSHPLGIFAIVVLLVRIVVVFKRSLNYLKIVNQK
jgi:uncharacterized protein DUF2752